MYILHGRINDVPATLLYIFLIQGLLEIMFSSVQVQWAGLQWIFFIASEVPGAEFSVINCS